MYQLTYQTARFDPCAGLSVIDYPFVARGHLIYKTFAFSNRMLLSFLRSDEMDVCGIFSMEFEGLRLNMRRLQNEADDLIKRIECVYSTTPYDHVKEFASKLYTLCDTLKYMAERLREMHHYGPEAWPLPESNPELLTRREGHQCEDEIDANFSSVGV